MPKVNNFPKNELKANDELLLSISNNANLYVIATTTPLGRTHGHYNTSSAAAGRLPRTTMTTTTIHCRQNPICIVYIVKSKSNKAFSSDAKSLPFPELVHFGGRGMVRLEPGVGVHLEWESPKSTTVRPLHGGSNQRKLGRNY